MKSYFQLKFYTTSQQHAFGEMNRETNGLPGWPIVSKWRNHDENTKKIIINAHFGH